jgi:hypothetical protein
MVDAGFASVGLGVVAVTDGDEVDFAGGASANLQVSSHTMR